MEVRVQYKVVLWGGPSDGQKMELSSITETGNTLPTCSGVHIAEIRDGEGNLYRRSNRISARHWVYRYEGEERAQEKG